MITIRKKNDNTTRSDCRRVGASGSNPILVKVFLLISVLVSVGFYIRALAPTKTGQARIIQRVVVSDMPTQNFETEVTALGDKGLRRAALTTTTTATTITRGNTTDGNDNGSGKHNDDKKDTTTLTPNPTTTTTTRGNTTDGNDNGNGNGDGKHNDDKKDTTTISGDHGKSSRPADFATPSTTEESEYDNSFSACLLIMDDNHLLVEWLAYHYTTLPLRRIIVAMDPRSATSPLPVLERWKGKINYTLWNDNDYVEDDLLQKNGCNFKGNEVTRAKLANETVEESFLQKLHWTWIHRLRQPTFMHACARQLRKENRSWTMYIDTDEYLVVNKYPILHEHLKNSFMQQVPHRELGIDTTKYTNTTSLQNETEYYKAEYPPMTSLQMLDNIIKYNVTKNMPKSNFLDYHKMYQSGCLGLPRMPVSTKESTTEEIQNQVPTMYNASKIATMRFRHINDERQSNGKPIVDLSRVPKKYMKPGRFLVHGGISGFCQNKLSHAVFLNSFFLANHYPLSFEQYGFRKSDSRGRASHESYTKRYKRKSEPKFVSDDMVRGWVGKFEDKVGTKEAQILLKGVGELVGEHQDTPNNYSTSLAYENCDYYNRPTGKFIGLPDDHFNRMKQ